MAEPVVTVEIAWTGSAIADPSTLTWSDVTADVNSIDGGYGRTTETDQIEAANITVVFDNSDGSYTPQKQYLDNTVAGANFDGPEPNPFTLTANMSIDTAQFHSGTKSLKVAALASGTASAARTKGTVAANPGDKIFVSFWANRDASWNGTGSNSKIRIADQAGALIGAVDYAAASLPTAGVWVQRTATITLPSTATGYQVFIVSDGTAGNCWLDDISVQKVNANYPNVVPYRPIRVSTTYNGTTTRTFYGVVERWSPGISGNLPTCTATVTDLLGLLSGIDIPSPQLYAAKKYGAVDFWTMDGTGTNQFVSAINPSRKATFGSRGEISVTMDSSIVPYGEGNAKCPHITNSDYINNAGWYYFDGSGINPATTAFTLAFWVALDDFPDPSVVNVTGRVASITVGDIEASVSAYLDKTDPNSAEDGTHMYSFTVLRGTSLVSLEAFRIQDTDRNPHLITLAYDPTSNGFWMTIDDHLMTEVVAVPTTRPAPILNIGGGVGNPSNGPESAVNCSIQSVALLPFSYNTSGTGNFFIWWDMAFHLGLGNPSVVGFGSTHYPQFCDGRVFMLLDSIGMTAAALMSDDDVAGFTPRQTPKLGPILFNGNDDAMSAITQEVDPLSEFIALPTGLTYFDHQFRSRAWAIASGRTPASVFGMTSGGYVWSNWTVDCSGSSAPETGVTLSSDIADIVTRVNVSNWDGYATTLDNTSAQAVYHIRSQDISVHFQDDDHALQRGYARLNRYSGDMLRITDISFNPGASDSTIANNALWALCIGIKFNDVLTLTNLPATMPQSSMSFFVEGVHHSIVRDGNALQWVTTLNLSPIAVDQAWVLGYSVLGTDTTPYAS